MTLPLVLAGPLLRRVEAGRVCVWLATSAAAAVRVVVARPGGGEQLGAGGATAARLGERLYVHLAEVRPDAEEFPPDQLLAYDVVVDAGDGEQRLADLGLVGGTDTLAYAGFDLPTFFVRRSVPALRLLHGSCRLLHGKGRDALVAADELLAATATDVAARPAALVLTGDQIYGDEVAGPLIAHLRRLADELCGSGDAAGVPGMPRLDEVGVYQRAELAAGAAAFTSGKADNHLFSFGEFAAMYITAWNERVWPQAFPTADAALPGAGARLRRRYDTERATLERTRRGLPAVRRLLANMPTYMIFDDHDVTDDWNLTAAWQGHVWDSLAGRRVVANALAGFWAFQGWGNDPELFGATFRTALVDHLGGEEQTGDAYDRTLWAFDGWSCVAATDPPALLLDTRTRRSFDSAEGAARLIGSGERERLLSLCRRAGHHPGDPLLLVSAVPLYGLELQERRQKFLVGKVGPYEIDFEAWHSNLAGLVEFMTLLIDDLRLPWCVVLSGDVHYGINIAARVGVGERSLRLVQLVSSSLKHSGAISRAAITALGGAVSAVHHRVGWDRPPESRGAHRVRRWFLSRAVNTDEWGEDTPVFLAPRRARQLGIHQPADYRESRRYIRPAERSSSVLVGDNNVGLVTLHPDRVTHELLASRSTGTRRYTVSVPLGKPAGARAAARQPC